MIKDKIKSLLKSKWMLIGILVYFLILSVVMFWPIRRATNLYWGDDMRYHFTRIEELYRTLAGGDWYSFITTNGGNKLGLANGIFYPNLFIYLFAGIRFIVNDPIKAIYFGIGVINYLTFLISYFTFKAYSKSRFKAFVFANLYGLSTYRYIAILTRFTIGEVFAMMFLPVVLWSFYEITYNKRYRYWPWLGLSMAALLYSHLMVTVMSAGFLLVMFLLSLKKITDIKATIKSYVFAVVTFCLLGAGYLFSFLRTYLSGVKKPTVHVLETTAYEPIKLFNASLSNSFVGSYNLGIMSLVIIVGGLLVYHKLNWLNRNLLVIAGILLVLTTKLFPWSYFQHVPFTLLQFPFRFLVFANILLAIVGTEVFTMFSIKKVILLLIPFMIMTQVAQVRAFSQMQYPPLGYVSSTPGLAQDIQKFKYHPYGNDQIYPILLEKSNYADYTPWPEGLSDKQKLANFKKVKRHQYSYAGHRGIVKNIKPIANGVIMSLNMKQANGNVTLPFYLYDLDNYQLTINNQVQKPRYNKYHNLVVSLKKGKNTIRIKYVPSKSQVISVWVSIISLIGLCFLPIYRRWRQKK